MFLELGLNIVTSIGGAILENLPILIESATNIVLTILNSLIAALPSDNRGRFAVGAYTGQRNFSEFATVWSMLRFR